MGNRKKKQEPGGAITKYKGEGVEVTAEIVPVSPVGSRITSAIAPGIKSFALKPEAEGVLNYYFNNLGVDLANIPKMSPEQIARFADVAEQSKLLIANLPKIEEHIKEYIKGVVEYNQFVARCAKAGFDGAKNVEKATLDAFLEHQGYLFHQKELGKKSDNHLAKLEGELEQFFLVEDAELEAALQIAASRAKKKIDAAKLKPKADEERVNQWAEIDTQYREENRAINQLIGYGTVRRGQLPASSTSEMGANSNGAGVGKTVKTTASGFVKGLNDLLNWFKS